MGREILDLKFCSFLPKAAGVINYAVELAKAVQCLVLNGVGR